MTKHRRRRSDITYEVTRSRPRNAATTRAAILAAARTSFCQGGYEDVGMRDIARQVGVDAAMVSRYFGCKEDLFAEALVSGGEKGRAWLQTPREEFGRSLARQLIYDPQDEEKLCGVMMMLRANGSAKACEIVRQVIAKEYMKPFEVWIGGEHAEARALLASSIMMGAVLCLSLNGPPEGEEEKRFLCDRLADSLQRCVDEAVSAT